MHLMKICAAALLVCLLGGCATESSRVVPTEKVKDYDRPYSGTGTSITVGKFDNKSSYMNGVFSNGDNRLGSQAKTILLRCLQQSGRFTVLDRENMSEIRQEAGLAKARQEIRGARYVITGDVTAFGRKNIGDRQFFGILGRGKE